MDESVELSLTGKDWTIEEVHLTVLDYFRMLEAEMNGEKVNKTAHRAALSPKLHGRSHASIEFKHQNISRVLVELGLPYIDGYKPARNRQQLLVHEVERFLEAHPDFLERLAATPTLSPTEEVKVSQVNMGKIIEDPPETIFTPPLRKPWLSRRRRIIDFAERDSMNKVLGQLGEKFVFELEKQRLLSLGRDDLSDKVVWASQTIGDGLGFDIISFDESDDSERMLEVKATGLGKYFPFYITENEVRCSEDVPEQYQLFRVFDFGRTPRLFILNGSLRRLCRLDPILYRASL